MNWYETYAPELIEEQDNLYQPSLTPDDILELVVNFTRTPRHVLLSKDRRTHVAFSRQILCYLLYELTPLSFPRVGQVIHRDHSTVHHAWKLISNRAKTDPSFKKMVFKIVENA